MTDKPGPEGPSHPTVDANAAQFDGLEIKFPFGDDIAAKALCVICNTGLPNQGVTLTLKHNIVRLSDLPKDPEKLIKTVQISAQQIMGTGSDEPVQLDFRRIPKKLL